MALSLLGPFNKIINQTAAQIVDSELPKKVSDVLTTVVSSSATVAEDLLKKVRDVTREEPKPETPKPSTP